MEVNTKETCFLCLRHTFGNTWAVDEDVCLIEDICHEQMNSYNLRPILRTIQLSKKLPADSKYTLDGISVSLCRQCGVVADYLRTLCLDLEALQMKVNWKLEEFKNILQKSSEDKERNNLFRNSMISEEFGEENYELAENLRKTLTEKCKLFLQSKSTNYSTK